MKFLTATLIFIVGIIAVNKVYSQGVPGRFTLDGRVSGRDSGLIVLWYPDSSGKWLRDTTEIEGSRFRFTGWINEPSYAHLIGSKGSGNYASFFLESTDQFIELAEGKFDQLTMTGSTTQAVYQKFVDTSALVEKKREALSSRLRTLTTIQEDHLSPSRKLELKKLKAALEKETAHLLELRIQFIKKHSSSYASVTELYGLLFNKTISFSEGTSLYENLTEEVKNSKAGQLCKAELSKSIMITKGVLFPPFTVSDINQSTVTLSQFRGRYLLLDFWASWCIPCRAQIPGLKQLMGQFGSSKFQILAISIDSSATQWKEAILKEKITNWYHVRFQESLAPILSIQSIPQQVLIDPEGRILWSSFEENDVAWQTILQKALK